MKGKLVITAALLLLAFAVTLTASAHGASQHTHISWGETNGWIIDENVHTNSTTVQYKINSSANGYTSIITGGADKWNNNSSFTVSQSPSAVGTIYAEDMSDPTINAKFCQWSTNSLGHLTSWKIIISTNPNANPTATTIAHEFGHAFGLNDLYESANYNKLMCGYATRTVSTPQDADRKGASVITGQHTSHSWTYRYFDTVNGHKRHRSACSGCWGWEYGSLVTNCTYSNAYCIYCGTHV